jgi:hypothetical protein
MTAKKSFITSTLDDSRRRRRRRRRPGGQAEDGRHQPGVNVIRLFTGCNLRILVISLSF